MQMVLEIEDSFVSEFQSIINKFKDKVQVAKDKNLELDPYFYERQKELEQDIKDIESGKVKMLSQSEYEKDMDDFFDKLMKKYAD